MHAEIGSIVQLFQESRTDKNEWQKAAMRPHFAAWAVLYVEGDDGANDSSSSSLSDLAENSKFLKYNFCMKSVG